VSPERLWLLSIRLRSRGFRRAARLLKTINSALYHNSLPVDVDVSPDIRFGHHGFGTVIHSNVTIGKRVRIWQNVTIAVRAPSGSAHRIVIEDDVKIGASSVIIAPAGRGLRIGRGARIGAGAVVAEDVPADATVISAPSRVLLRESGAEATGEAEELS
jgi:serine O-acetyltransferase